MSAYTGELENISICQHKNFQFHASNLQLEEEASHGWMEYFYTLAHVCTCIAYDGMSPLNVYRVAVGPHLIFHFGIITFKQLHVSGGFVVVNIRNEIHVLMSKNPLK